ncbi:hypothetical protein SSYM_0297, partial [Serratia symbiotica str. Tucson]
MNQSDFGGLCLTLSRRVPFAERFRRFLPFLTFIAFLRCHTPLTPF